MHRFTLCVLLALSLGCGIEHQTVSTPPPSAPPPAPPLEPPPERPPDGAGEARQPSGEAEQVGPSGPRRRWTPPEDGDTVTPSPQPDPPAGDDGAMAAPEAPEAAEAPEDPDRRCEDGVAEGGHGVCGECGEGCGAIMKAFPAGEFFMGSPRSEACHSSREPLRVVQITRPFLVWPTEVTQAQWRAVMGRDPSTFRECDGEGECPVDSVTWLEAIDFCNALSRLEGLEQCYEIGGGRDLAVEAGQRNVSWPLGPACTGYRLPTHAEWEYAARAGDRGPFHGGDLSVRDPCRPWECSDRVEGMDAVGWYCGNSGDRPHAVALKSPNAAGLYDVHGNLTEWTWNRTTEDLEIGTERVDPTGPERGGLRIHRSGCYGAAAFQNRAAAFGAEAPWVANPDHGLRPVRTIPSGRSGSSGGDKGAGDERSISRPPHGQGLD